MNLLEVYLAIGFAFIVFGAIMMLYRQPLEMRVGARMMLAAPVWPIALAAGAIFVLYKLVRWFIRSVRTLSLIAFNKHPDWR